MLKRRPALVLLLSAFCVVFLSTLVRAQSGQSITKTPTPDAKGQAVRKPPLRNQTDHVAGTPPAPLPVSATDAAQVLADKQLRAANSQAKAAWFQAWTAFAQAIITAFLFWLTMRQLSEGKKDRDETIKGRKLSLMPVVSCDIQYTPPQPADAANSQSVQATLMLLLNNIGNAAALELHPRIASLKSGHFNYAEVPINLASSNLALSITLTQTGITIPVPVSSGDTSPARRAFYFLSVGYVNVYKQKFITETVYQTAHDSNGAAHWSKIAEQFFILDWNDTHENQRGEEWARERVRTALNT